MMDSSMQHALRTVGLVAPAAPAKRKEVRPEKPAKPYRYRGLPCSIASDDQLWYVGGTDELGGSGILEWCYDQTDASTVLANMRRYPQFSNLSAAKYQE